MKFEELDLSDHVLDALYDMRFEECTPIQEKCIPEILDGHDILGVAQTGTGKTAAYLLPILSKLDDGGYPKDAVNCVIMSPTRELAQQIDQAMEGFSYYLDDVSSVAVYGGNDGNRYDQEMKSMRLGADVIIATPGRLISHISMGNIDLSRVSFFVLDEADRMLDMGFSEDIMKIASKLPKDCQMIMFSATMPNDIEKLAQTLLKNPVEVKIAVSKPAEKIKQSAYICYETQKLKIINDIFKAGDLKRVLIFSGSKMKVKQINQALQHLKINSGEMHSDLEQAERDEVMYKFKSGQIDVLVATDIVARGIDIDDIAMVINYDVPHDAEDYVHRIGRTARAERDGVAITLVNEDDMYYFAQIEKFLGKDIEKNQLPEICGDGPEYIKSRRPSKTTAKSRRRKDRDNNAHRNAKRHDHGRDQKRPRQQGQRTQDGEQPQGQHEGQQGTKPVSRQHNNQRGGKPTENQEQARPNSTAQGNGQPAESKRNGRKHKGGERQEGRQPQGAQQPQDAGQAQGQRGGKRGGRKQGRKDAAQQPRTERQRRPATTKTDEKKEAGLKALIKKPLSWLKGLGKK